MSDDSAKRDDEYADQAVQTFRAAKSEGPASERKIVIPSREAETVKVKHEDVPALAAAIARERERMRAADEGGAESGRGSDPSAPDNGPKSSGRGMQWLEDRESFDPETFSSELQSSKSAPELVTREKPRWGGLLLLLSVVVLAGAGALFYLNGGELPAGMGGASQPAEASPATTATAEQATAETATAETASAEPASATPDASASAAVAASAAPSATEP